jgi:hypothetical protein
MNGRQQNNENQAMALPSKLAVRVSLGSTPSLLSVGINQERNPHPNNSLSFILVLIADTARTTATYNTSEEYSLSFYN